jgi:hypothetical protein
MEYPKLPRVIGSIDRPLQLSSPVPGRPKLFWTEGINPEIVREHWPSYGEQPYQQREWPVHLSSKIPAPRKMYKCYALKVTRKMVVYDRTHPQIRLELLLDAPYEREGETWQPILRSRVERDRGVDPKRSRALEQKLWDEVCRVERRGRPRGTGRPKRRLSDFAISSKHIEPLRRAGLDDRDLRILFGRWHKKTYRQIGGELGISAQAVSKRWNRRIEPAINGINLNFSRRSFQLSSLDS